MGQPKAGRLQRPDMSDYPSSLYQRSFFSMNIPQSIPPFMAGMEAHLPVNISVLIVIE
jgi:hypothetical protein